MAILVLGAGATLAGCASRPEVVIDNQTTVTLKGLVQMPVREVLGRVRPGEAVFVRVLPGEKWTSRGAEAALAEPEAVEDVVFHLADASLVTNSPRALHFAYAGRIGAANVTIRQAGAQDRTPGAMIVNAKDASGNVVELMRPPPPIELPPDTRRPVLDTLNPNPDIFR